MVNNCICVCCGNIFELSKPVNLKHKCSQCGVHYSPVLGWIICDNQDVIIEILEELTGQRTIIVQEINLVKRALKELNKPKEKKKWGGSLNPFRKKYLHHAKYKMNDKTVKMLNRFCLMFGANKEFIFRFWNESTSAQRAKLRKRFELSINTKKNNFNDDLHLQSGHK